MEWIETVLMEVNGTKQSPFDIEYSKVNLDLDSMIITTTTRTTDLVKVSDFRNWKQSYFVTKIVLTYYEKKLFYWLRKKLLKFEAEGREFAKFLRSLEQFIQAVKGQNNLR